MKINIFFQDEKIPDYSKGETIGDKKSLSILYNGKTLDAYSVFMDKDDIEIAITCIQRVLSLYKKKQK